AGRAKRGCLTTSSGTSRQFHAVNRHLDWLPGHLHSIGWGELPAAIAALHEFTPQQIGYLVPVLLVERREGRGMPVRRAPVLRIKRACLLGRRVARLSVVATFRLLDTLLQYIERQLRGLAETLVSGCLAPEAI